MQYAPIEKGDSVTFVHKGDGRVEVSINDGKPVAVSVSMLIRVLQQAGYEVHSLPWLP